MGKKPARKYSGEFRKRAIRLCVDSGRPIADVARDLDVPYQTFYKWMFEAGKAGVGGSRDAPPPKVETSDEELRRLRRELDEVKLERDFLKKAAVYSTAQRNTTTSDGWLKKVVTHAGSQTRLVPKRED